MLSRDALSHLDVELAALARSEAALRLRLGQALEVLGRGAHFELGFSSLSAYSLERCERSVRWVESARCLARRLEQLPELRRAVAVGLVSWSMGEILVRVAQPETESTWLEAAKGCTVREMRARVSNASGIESAAHDNAAKDDEEKCLLTCTLDREDAWLFEATRALLGQLGTHGDDAQLEALLTEGHGTLLGALPRGALDECGAEEHDTAQQRWNEQLALWRTQAEALCEERIRRSAASASESVQAGTLLDAIVKAAAGGCRSLESMSGREVDAAVCELSRMLARQELELARGISSFHRADGWRRLGYATETQYARERLGLSRSSLLARRSLGLRLEQLPRVAEALGSARIGVEAALQIVRVATSCTEAAWVERAQQRTIKHLREEVAAALVAIRVSGERDCPPPVDAEMLEFQNLERAVVAGGPCVVDGRRAYSEAQCVGGEPVRRRAWGVMLSSLACWLEGGFRMSAAGLVSRQEGPCAHETATQAHPQRRDVASAGRVVLRLRVSRATYTWWRRLEAQARRWLPQGMSWLKFLCLSFWRAWQHMLGTDAAYGQIYIRDRFRCTSPVCNRRDVTPHHLQFRSAGGSDEDDNVAAVCTWCHLFGVHGGRIRAKGTADHIDWELGPRDQPCLVVHGRERVAA